MTRFTFLQREIRRRPLRMLLALVSVALGVAGVISIRMASLSAREVFQQLQDAVGGKFDLEIVSVNGDRFESSLIEPVSDLPFVSSVSPVLNRTTVAYSNGKRSAATAMGIHPDDRTMQNRFEITEGRLFGETEGVEPGRSGPADAESDAAEEDEEEEGLRAPRTEIVLDAGFARMLQTVPGDTLTLLLPKGPVRCRVTGIFNLREGVGAAAEASIILKLSDLQEAAKAANEIDQARLVLKKEMTIEEASERIASQLDQALTVRALVRAELAAATLKGVEYALSFAQALVFAMAVFVTLNTCMISIGERRRQWGILLAIGMTRRQLMQMLLGESLLVGLLGSALGLGLGIVGAMFLSRAISTLMETPPVALPSDPVALLIAVISGPLLTVIACYLPARTASRIPPVEAMRGEEPQSVERFPRSIVWMAVGVWSLSTIVIILSLNGWLHSFVSIPAGITMMLGFVLMIPPLLEPLVGRLSRFLLEPFWPAEAELARRQVFLKPRRAVLTTAVLIVALADGIGLGHAVINTLDDVRGWYRRTLSADIVLIPGDPSLSSTFAIRSKSSVQSQLADVDGVTRVKTLRLANIRANDLPAVLVSREFPQAEPLPWHFSKSRSETVRSELHEGQIILGSMLAHREQLAVGDSIQLEHAGRTGQFRIAAVVTDYFSGGLSLFMERDAAYEQLGIDGVDMFLLNVDPANRPVAEAGLDSICKGYHLNRMSFDFLQSFLDGMMSKVVSAFWTVLAIGLLVAGFGTFNTLSMNVLEQTREIGLMRIIGMTRPQVLRTITFQAILLGLLGCILGTIAGITTAYIIHLCMGGLLMREMPFVWQPFTIIACNLLALILLVPASLHPAMRAIRMDQWKALQYE